MGANPKRTVTVQMVPQLAVVDTLGNKESNAKWTKDPNLNLCPASTLPSTDHKQDNLCLDPAPTETIPNTQTSLKGGDTVPGSDKPVPTNGNQEIFGPPIGDDHQIPDSSPTGGGVGKAGEGQRDNNANLRILTPEEKENICKGGVQTEAPKVDVQTNDRRVKVPSVREERHPDPMEQLSGTSTNKASPLGNNSGYAAHGNQRPEKAVESKQAASEVLTPRWECQKGVLATTDKDNAIPLKSKGPCGLHNLSDRSDTSPAQSQHTTQISKAETISPAAVQTEQKIQAVIQPQQSRKTTALLHPTAPATESQNTNAGMANINSATNLQSPKSTQITVSVERKSSAMSQELENKPKEGGVVGEAIQTLMTVASGQQTLNCKLYSEASTMTSSLSSTPNKQFQNVEVQAVANTCCKAVSTSPSLLPFTIAYGPSAGVLPEEEAQSLAVVYQLDSAVRSHQIASPSQVFIDSVPSSVETRSEKLILEAGLCPKQNAGVVLHTEAGSALQNTASGAEPKELGLPPCTTQRGPPPLQPVYQINIEHSTQKEQEASVSHHQSGTISSHCKPRAEQPSLSEIPSLPVSSAQTPAVETPSSQLEPPLETDSTCKAKSTDSHTPAAPSHSDRATKPNQAPSTSTAAHGKSKSSKIELERSKDKGKPAGKEKNSVKQNLQPERSKEEEESGKNKGKSVQDVVWDEQGMTWEVYGASVDPESLGFAIQSHLQCKIKEQERKLIVRTSIRKSITGADSPQGRKKKRRRQNVFRSMLKNVRRPNCCARPSSSSVLE